MCDPAPTQRAPRFIVGLSGFSKCMPVGYRKRVRKIKEDGAACGTLSECRTLLGAMFWRHDFLT